LTYDVRNRVLTKSRTVNSLGSSADTLTYTYDAQGNLGSIKSGNTSGVDLAYGYDTLNRLSTVSTNDQQAGARKVTDYTYDTVGNLNSVTLPNTVTSLYTYDALNRLTVLNVNLGAGMAFNRFAYTLSPTGQRTQVVEMNNRTTTYAYDTRYRLTQEAVTAGTLDAAPAGTVNYTYDQVGNRLASTSSLAGVFAQTNSFDPDDRQGSDTYDANGNTKAATLLGSPVADVYDFENHLLNRNGGQVQIAYDCDGNRVAKIVGTTTTTFLVDENNPTGYAQVLEEKVNGALVRTYAYGTGLLSEGQFSGGAWKTSYYALDGHGSARFLSDATGTATDFYTYDAFGNLVYKAGATANAYLYCGEQYDSDLGLYDLRARYMEPGRGRFWTQDSFEGGDKEGPSGLHKYLFSENDPCDLSDPSGEDPDLLSVAVTVGIVGSLSGCLATPELAGHLPVVVDSLNYEAASNGLNIRLGAFTANRIPRYPEYRWVQFVTTNALKAKNTEVDTPYNDPQPPDDAKPFFWTDAELPSHQHLFNHDLIFEDSPRRDPRAHYFNNIAGTIHWRAALDLVGVSPKGSISFVPIIHITYGFDVTQNGAVTLIPLKIGL
jgi:RHS repeat-associated protein